MRKIFYVFLATTLLFLLQSSPASASELIERGANYERYDLGDGKFAWQSAPQFVFNGSEWVPYIYEDTGSYLQVQSGLIAVRIFDYYAEFYTPDMSEIRVYDERWEVERWKVSPGSWDTIGAQSGTPTYKVTESGNGITITKTFTCWAGTLEINYIFREGSLMKHEVVWTSTLADDTTFRVLQKWSGIVGDRVQYSGGETVITGQTVLDSPVFTFKDGDSMTVFESQYVMEQNLRPTSIDIHAQGMKADFIFENWTLAQNENLVIDPDTATLSDPTEDGNLINWTDLYFYRQNSPNAVEMARDHWATTPAWTRGYVEWNVSSIPDSATITNVTFKYQGIIHEYPNTDAHIHEMLGAQPSVVEDNETVYNEAGEGTVYADPDGFPVSGANQSVDLDSSADTDLQNQLSVDWFALGFQLDDEATAGERYSDFASEDWGFSDPNPTLYVEYTMPQLGPNSPTDLLTEGQTNPTQITDLTPEFSAIGTDNNGDNMENYALQVSDSGFDASELLDNLESGWSYTESDPSGRFSDGGNVTDWYTEGTASRRADYDGNAINAGDYMRISKDIDLTGIDNILFDYKTTISGGMGNRVVFRMLVDGDNVWTSPTGDSEEIAVTVNVSGYSGSLTIAFEYIHTGGGVWDEVPGGSFWVDNLRRGGSLIYNKTKTAITSFENGTRCTDVSYENSDLARGTTYYWRIKFWDSNDNEGSWATETATFKINQLPNQPTNLLPSVRQTTVNVTISANVTDNDGDNMNVYFYDNSDNSAIDNIWTENGTTAQVTWSSLTRGNTYTFFVGAKDNNSEWGENSTTQTFIVNALPTAPTGWTNLGIHLIDHSPTITWTKGTDGDGDTVWTFVYLGTTSTPTEVDASTTAETDDLGENASHSTYPLTDGSTYYYRLRSWDGYEWSTSYTTADEFRMNTPPTLATDWTDLGMNLVDHTPTVTWTEGTDTEGDTITSYIYVGTTSTPTDEETYTTNETADLGSTITLDDGTTYYYRFRTHDGYEYSGYTTSDEFRMNTPPSVSPVVIPSSPATADDLVCTANESDNEGDSISLAHQWYEDNILMGGETDNILDSSKTNRGDNYKCEVTPYDSYEYGSPENSNEVIIQNSSPEIILVSVDNVLIDRDIDDIGSEADVSTIVTLRIKDNDGRDEIVDAWIAVRDNKDVVRENENVFSTATIVDENTLDFTFTVNPLDNLPDNALGYWDVLTYTIDEYESDENTNLNMFTVGDMGTTVVFSPENAWWHWELSASGTVYRIDGGAASASDVWYIDEAENRIYTFSSSNNWETAEYTINSQPGENITIKVVIWDSPLDGVVFDNYTVLFENWKFQTTLRWEENFLVITENVENMGLYINFIYEEWETETVQLTENIENFTLDHEPRMVRLWDSIENYHRTYKIDRAKIDIYLVGPDDLVFLKQYHVQLDDPLLVWGPPDGSIAFFKFEEDVAKYMFDSYWTAASDVSPWLVYGEIYRIRLESPDMETLDYGIFDADLITSRIIIPSLQAPTGDIAEVYVITEMIAWSLWFDSENGLNMRYQDNLEGTNWTTIRVKDENATTMWSDNVVGNSWQENWSGADENQFYVVFLRINHDVYIFPESELTSSRVYFGAMPTGVPELPHDSPSPLNILGTPPVPWGNLFIAGLLFLTLFAFGPQAASIGCIMTGAVAIFLYLIAIAPISWELGALMIFVGVMVLLLERREPR